MGIQAAHPTVGCATNATTAQSAVLQVAVFDPANNEIPVYYPIVFDVATKLAAAPAVPLSTPLRIAARPNHRNSAT